ncbi:pectate lyase-like adhesive domain-containing protein [Holzapfeliella sp. JNUCC 80]
MYNKNKIQKTNEKKIMKKVKKQWVVASLVTFALLGGGVVTSVQSTSQQVMADDVISGNNQPASNGNSENQPVQSETGTADEGQQDGITAGQQNSDTATDENNQRNKTQDYKTAYNNARKGYLDGNTYSQDTGNNDTYYIAGYNSNPVVKGTNAGLSAAKQTPIGSEVSDNDESTYKRSYENAFKGFAAGKNNDTVANSDINQDNIYQKAFQLGKQATQTAEATDEQNGINAGTQAAQSDALDGAKNYSIDDRAQTSRVLPTSGSPVYQEAYQKAYDAVVLGTNNGSQNGIGDKYNAAYSVGQNIRVNNQTVLVSNGAQLDAAIQDRTKTADNKDSITTIKAVKDISMWSTRGKSNSTTVATYNNGGEIAFSKSITIDGGGHTIDFAGSRYAQSTASDITMKNMVMYGTEYYGTVRTNAASNITYDNFRYYGPQLIESGSAKITVKNKVEASSTKLQYKPSDIVQDAEDENQLNPRLNVSLSPTDGGGTQEMITASNVTFSANSTFDGYTNNGPVISLTGTPSVTVQTESTVNLHPKGTNSNAYGLFMSSGNFNVANNANFNIIPERNSNGNLAGALDMNGGTLTIDGGKFNVKLNGNTGSQLPVDVGGNILVENAGQFILENRQNNATVSTPTSLMNVRAGLTVKDKSVLGMYASGDANVTLLSAAGGVDIQNPGSETYQLGGKNAVGVTFDLNDNHGAKSSAITGSRINIKNIVLNDKPYANVLIPSDNATGGNLVGTGLGSTQSNDKTDLGYYGSTNANDDDSNNKKTRYLNFLAAPNFKLDNNSLKLERDTTTGKLFLKGSYQFMDSNDSFNPNNKNLYLGAYKGDTALNGTVSNDDFPTDTNKYSSKNTKNDYQDLTSVPFAIELPNNLKQADLKALSVKGQYIVGSDSQKLQISDSDAQAIASDTTAADNQSGVEAFLNNRNNANYNPRSDSRYGSNDNYTAGYDKAKAGYNDGISGQDNSGSISEGISRNAYLQGYHQVQTDENSARTGLSDYNADSTKSINETKAQDDSYKNGFNGAKDGQQDGAAGITKSESELKADNKNKAYKDAYNDSNQQAKDARDGAIDSINAKGQGAVSTNKSPEYQAGFNGAKDAQTGDGKAKATDANYQTGYNLAKGTKDGLAKNQDATVYANDKGYKAGYDAVSAGAQAYQAGKESTADKDDKQQSLYDTNASYRVGYDEAKQAADDYAGGKVADKTSGIYNDVYQDAKNGHDKYNENPDVSAADLAKESKAYQDAYHKTKTQVAGSSDYSADSTKSMNETKAQDDSYKNGFNGAKDGQQDGAAGITKSESELKADNKNKAYKDAYNDSNQQAKDARDGAIDSINAKGQGAVSTNKSPEYQAGFNGAKDAQTGDGKAKATDANYQTGYNLAKGTKDGLAKNQDATVYANDKGYKAGYDAVSAGAQAYQAGKESTADKDDKQQSLYDTNASYRVGYDEAKQAADDYAGGKVADKTSGIYNDVYQDAKNGHDKYNENPDVSAADLAKESKAYQDAYHKTKTQVAGSSDYSADSTKSMNETKAQDDSYKNGFNGAKDGQQDGAAGITKSESELKADNKNKAYKDAYNDSNQQAKDARDGAQDAIKGDSSKYNQSGTPAAYNKGYEGAQKGLAKDTTDVSKDANTQTGYNLGQATTDALAKAKGPEYDSDKGYQSAYDAVTEGAKAYQAGRASTADKDDKQQSLYDTNASYRAGYDEAQQAANDYSAGKVADKTSGIYNDVYTDAKNGHDDAQKSNTNEQAPTDGSKSQQYQDSYNAAIAAVQGKKDYLNDGNKTKESQYSGPQKEAYNKAYEGAKDGQEKGLTGATAMATGKPVSYQDGYRSGYSKGYDTYQDGLTSANVNAVQAMVETGNPIKDYTGPYASVYKQAYEVYQNGQQEAAKDLENGIKPDLTNKSKAYVNGYNNLISHAVQAKVNYTPNANVLVWSLNQNGKPVQTEQYKQGYQNIVVTDETMLVNGVSYTKLATDNNAWIQTQYLDDSNATPQKVNYIEGYGVLIWNSDGSRMVGSNITESALANVKTYDQKVVEGVPYTRINAKDSDQWIQTQYLQNTIPETSGVVSLGNVPQNYAIYLRDGNGKMTNQALYAGTSWKVFESKKINGQLFYRLGSDNQWVEAKYADEFKV